MKRNDLIFLSALLAYSILFYAQNAGVNFLLFSLALPALFLWRTPVLARSPQWVCSALLCLVSGAGVLITSSDLAITANCLCLLLLSGVSFNQSSSFLFAFVFSLYSFFSASVWMILDAVRRSSEKRAENNKKGYQLAAAFGVVFILFAIFLSLYQDANPLFAENTRWINLDFLSLRWIFFTLGGLFIVYPLCYHKRVSAAERWEKSLPDRAAQEPGSERAAVEMLASITLFVLLNLLLLLLNYGDVSTLWLRNALPPGITHSAFVHHGVGTLIVSILLATSVLLYMFRSDFQNLRGKSFLKALVYLWIVQNLLMLVSTAQRNGLYIHEFNLTHKRIGVFAWLFLAFAGLIMVWIKIASRKSSWFLVRHTFSLWIAVLALSSLFNWDLIITRYNIANKPLSQVDFNYLFRLSASNIPELLEVSRRPGFYQSLYQSERGSLEERTHHHSFEVALRYKIYFFLTGYISDPRSFDLSEDRIVRALKLK